MPPLPDKFQNDLNQLRQQLLEELLRSISLRLDGLSESIADLRDDVSVDEEQTKAIAHTNDIVRKLGNVDSGVMQQVAAVRRDIQRLTAEPDPTSGIPAGSLHQILHLLRQIDEHAKETRRLQEDRLWSRWTRAFLDKDASNMTRFFLVLPVLSLMFLCLSILSALAFHQTPEETIHGVMEAVVCPIQAKILP